MASVTLNEFQVIELAIKMLDNGEANGALSLLEELIKAMNIERSQRRKLERLAENVDKLATRTEEITATQSGD